MVVPFRRQQRDYWCGPASVQMLLAANGHQVSQVTLASHMYTNVRAGTSRRHLVRGLRTFGLAVGMTRAGTLARLAQHLPVIVNYQASDGEDHYAVILRVTSSHVVMHDPWYGPNYKLTRAAFCQRWKNPKLRKKYTGWFVQVG